MYQNDSTIFEVSLNETSQQYLREIAKWSKFLAIVGLVVGILISIVGLLIMLMGGSAMFEKYGAFGAFGSIIGVVYILMGLLYIYPCMKQKKFANQIVSGMANQDQETITLAFENLKSVFKFWGILTIIIISLYALIFVAGGVVGAFTD
ncbi:MAG TPA: DUF5362 family protein [Phnomibacter sp.]|nr:DUF5362 family protein [Phnomibacter sp.]